MPTLATNKKARYEYQILDTYEAGLELKGHEVKSVRDGKMGLTGTYVTLSRGAAWLVNAHIPAYPKAGPLTDYDPYRTRRLLLHRRELMKLAGKLEQKGLTLVPLSVYTKRSLIKVEIALAKGKQQFEKREAIKKRDVERDIRRSMKA